METWKSVNNDSYNHVYEVSNKGNVRKIKDKRICSKHIRNGYYAINFYDPEIKKKNTVNVHRIVALTFLEKTAHCVNHKNGNKLDNDIDNLEWVSPIENTAHAIKTKLTKTHPRRVKQLDMEGNLINIFDSIIEAESKTSAKSRQISAVCKYRRKTSGGFKWEYETPDNTILTCDGEIIKDFPNYKITKDGKVYSKRSKKYLVPKKLQSGYLCVKLCNNGIYKDAYIQKLVREYYPKDSLVLSCSEKSNNGSGENSEVEE